MTTEDTFETLDLSSLADVNGGNYGKECAKGAAAGAIGGALAGPKGMLAGGILGCLGGIASHAIDRHF